MAKRSKSLDPQDTEDLEGTDLTEEEAIAAIEANRTVPADVAETFCQKMLEAPPTDQFHGLPYAVAERLRASQRLLPKAPTLPVDHLPG